MCVIDNYLTKGISFETVRNLLLEVGAKRIILLALEPYKREEYGIYQNQFYKFSGDIIGKGYQYELTDRGGFFGVMIRRLEKR
ncbi:hypothetical protein [Priestia sp. P5]|uniref:hypothetical protein n=1 Tax=Priestia sp. P5 TaxID=2917806 RepID=UPI00240579E8|nr:hypothetical protein [Priestia sp. P5]MDG0059149.1 hypothetical protein [Priestia sp. P5]